MDSGPNFGLSGKLAAETNTVKGVVRSQAECASFEEALWNSQPCCGPFFSQVLKYNEPPEARKPNKNWRLYVFKGKEQLGEQ